MRQNLKEISALLNMYDSIQELLLRQCYFKRTPYSLGMYDLETVYV